MPLHTHIGIRCAVDSPLICFAVQQVLQRIARAFPEDFDRLVARVAMFNALESENPALVGRFRVDGGNDFAAPGVVELRRDAQLPVALVAHECGHACTRRGEFGCRARYDEQWAGEMCADRYARKWGFGRYLDRRPLNYSYRGPEPGQEFTIGPDDTGQIERYRVTRRSCIRLVQVETSDGTVIETASQRLRRIRAECSFVAKRVDNTTRGQNVIARSLCYARTYGLWFKWRQGEIPASVVDPAGRRQERTAEGEQELPFDGDEVNGGQDESDHADG